MSIHIVPLTKCPFCEDGDGDIFLDANVPRGLMIKADAADEEANHANLVIHNSPRFAEGPCVHLVQLFMDVSWGRDLEDHIDSKWTVEVAWKCPPLRELALSDPARDLLLDFEFRDEYEAFLPREPHRFECFSARWRDVKHCDGPRHCFEASGRTVFALHIPSFIHDLSRQHERIQVAMESGWDVRGEWREILAQRNVNPIMSTRKAIMCTRSDSLSKKRSKPHFCFY